MILKFYCTTSRHISEMQLAPLCCILDFDMPYFSLGTSLLWIRFGFYIYKHIDLDWE